MKSERRHELQQNVLDAELSKAVTFFRKYGATLSWAALALIILIFIGMYAYRQHQTRLDNLQTDYVGATLLLRQMEAGISFVGEDPVTKMRKLAEQDSDRRIAAMASVALGDFFASQYEVGLMAVKTSETAPAGKDAASQIRTQVTTIPAEMRTGYYNDAQACYQAVLDKYPENALQAARARVGLAKLAEDKGDLARAREYYEETRKMTELVGEPVMIEAERSLARLADYKGPVRMATTTQASTAKPSVLPAPEAKSPQTK
jgi:tetratricopeptide (TPR) repeat protein